jgi:hypothetical protein
LLSEELFALAVIYGLLTATAGTDGILGGCETTGFTDTSSVLLGCLLERSTLFAYGLIDLA